MSYPAFCRSRQIKTGRLIAPIICFLPALLLLLAVPLAGAQTLPLPTHAAGFYTAGSVRAVAVDASGRFYIGGYFSFVNGVPRHNLARFNADGTLDTAWNPNPDSGVLALAVAGDTVYVGGYFTTIGGQARNHIAALDAGAGAATAWNPNADSWVDTLAVAGDTVYAGGSLHQPSAGRRAESTSPRWTQPPGPPPPGIRILMASEVSALAVAGDTVYVGEDFTTIGGQARNGLAALDARPAGPPLPGIRTQMGRLGSWPSRATRCMWEETSPPSAGRRAIASPRSTRPPGPPPPGIRTLMMRFRDLGRRGRHGVCGRELHRHRRAGAQDGLPRWTRYREPPPPGIPTLVESFWSGVYALTLSGNTVYAGGTSLLIGGAIHWAPPR